MQIVLIVLANFSLYKAVQILCANHVHRLPVLDRKSGNIAYILTHKRLIKYLYLYVSFFFIWQLWENIFTWNLDRSWNYGWIYSQFTNKTTNEISTVVDVNSDIWSPETGLSREDAQGARHRLVGWHHDGWFFQSVSVDSGNWSELLSSDRWIYIVGMGED